MHALVVLFAAVFTNNIALANFLGMCPFIAVSRDVKTAFGMGMAVTLVMTLTSAANWAIQRYLLEPFGVEHLQFIIFIVVIAAIVQVLELAIERFSPDLYASFGVFLALITVNCAILGVSLFMVLRGYGFLETVGYGIGSGLGWTLAITALAGIREKIEKSDIPAGLKGPGITMISAGIMAMAFIGLTGLI
jgi:Na+-transporting NADH:ubiquinone oxidoreductase subunit E